MSFVLSAVSSVAGDIRPGETWYDTNGSAINAHGGCVVYHEGVYYWFGEQRSGNKSDGISCYSSTDFYSWKRVGRAVTPTGAMTDACEDILLHPKDSLTDAVFHGYGLVARTLLQMMLDSVPLQRSVSLTLHEHERD